MSPDAAYPRVQVLVLNYNGLEDTRRCVSSLLADGGAAPSDIVIVDNGSSDGSPAELRRSFPGVRLVEHGRNLGYAEGYNKVLGELMSEGKQAFLLLNNDTVVHKDSLGKMEETLLASPDTGVVGPAIIDMGAANIQSMGISANWWRGKSPPRNGAKDYGSVPHGVEDVDFVSGSAMLIRREVIEKVGAFPSHFFLYSEEKDLCFRAKKAGYRVVCDSRAVVEHRKESTVRRYPELQAYYVTRNRFLVTKRHAGLAHMMTFTFWMLLVEVPFSWYQAGVAGNGVGLATLKGMLRGLVMAADEPRF